MKRSCFLLLISVGLIQIYLLFYPIFCGCVSIGHYFWDTSAYRLLIFADPQIEGDDKIRAYGMSGRLDLWGNDRYLSFIREGMQRVLRKPYEVALLGDLMSSQWIGDEEFHRRADRLVNQIFSGLNDMFIAIGNHDVGYSGDVAQNRIVRWKERFGKFNRVETRRIKGSSRKKDKILRIVLFDSLNLDGPDNYLRKEAIATLDRLQKLEKEEAADLTIALTHVPLYKPEKFCVDGPMFTYFEDGSIREQNQLSQETSIQVLESLPMRTILLNGHDHYGCTTYHVRASDEFFPLKKVGKLDAGDYAIPEYTIRSMMGFYGGNSAVLRLYQSNNGLDYELTKCRFADTAVWWILEIYSLLAVGAAVALSFWDKIVALIRSMMSTTTYLQWKDFKS